MNKIDFLVRSIFVIKHQIKRLLIPIMLALLGITTAVFVAVINPKTSAKKVFTNQYIAIKIKPVYPFYLLFKKGITLKQVLKKFKVGAAHNIYLNKDKNNKNKLDLDMKLYEDYILKIG